MHIDKPQTVEDLKEEIRHIIEDIFQQHCQHAMEKFIKPQHLLTTVNKHLYFGFAAKIATNLKRQMILEHFSTFKTIWS